MERERPKLLAALCETAGQFTYVFAIGANAILAAPTIASYSIFSVLWSCIFLKGEIDPLNTMPSSAWQWWASSSLAWNNQMEKIPSPSIRTNKEFPGRRFHRRPETLKAQRKPTIGTEKMRPLWRDFCCNYRV